MNQSGPPIKLAVFLVACKRKPDQMAGFRSFALSRSLGPMSMLEWEKTYKEFLARPVR